MNGKELLGKLNAEKAAELFAFLYGPDGVDDARRRYGALVGELLDERAFPPGEFPEASGDIRVFSVPGRTELGGNHTDHNQGKVLAASIQLDAAAVVAPRKDNKVFFRSVGHPDVIVDVSPSNLSPSSQEKGNTEALVRGIAAEFAARGTPVGGFTANAASRVLTGSGLSSSAAVEVLFAKIFDTLYAGGTLSALELAQIGQKAENVYFGKPCGLMDQIACASGGAVAIDFGDLANPLVTRIDFDPAAAGYSLCIVDTKGSHSDLTPDYAAIPGEMKAAAAFFNTQVLRHLDEDTLMARLSELRKSTGDRAILRALHFFGENRRVDAMLAALEKLAALPAENIPAGTSPAKAASSKDIPLGDARTAMDTFLALVRESGDSSWELLQNVYSPKNPAEQGLTLALALTKNFLGQRGACRVHGGGFAGTIQAYIPSERLEEYRKLMEGVFGNGTLTVLRIRPWGAVELNF